MPIDRSLPQALIVAPEHNYRSDNFEPLYTNEDIEFLRTQHNRLLRFIELLDENPDQREELGVTEEDIELYYRASKQISSPGLMESKHAEYLNIEPDPDGKWRGAKAFPDIASSIKGTVTWEKLSIEFAQLRAEGKID